MDLGLLQKEVATELGLTKETISNWETDASTPITRFMPALRVFLGEESGIQTERFKAGSVFFGGHADLLNEH